VSIGVAISFGMLDIVNIAHPAFILLGSYVAFHWQHGVRLDPILRPSSCCRRFYLLGMAAYQVYYVPPSGATTSHCAACRSSSASCSSPKWAADPDLRRRYRSVRPGKAAAISTLRRWCWPWPLLCRS